MFDCVFLKLQFGFGVLISALLLFLSLPASAQEPPPFPLPRTEVFELHSADIGQTYEIRVALPNSYGASDAPDAYPVVVLLDADFAFPIASTVATQLAIRNDQLPEMIVVAIAYPGAADSREVYHRTRTRDYTPFFFPTGGYGPEIQQLSGGGPEFLSFIENDLFPALEARYPISADDRTLEGHSYGGLFATWTLLTRPDLFARWIIVSPSYWYADEFIYDYENEFAASHDVLNEVVFAAVGSWEVNDEIDMVDLLDRFVTQMRSRGYEGLSLDTYVFLDDTHASVWPAAFTRGARSVFNEPLPGPANPPADR